MPSSIEKKINDIHALFADCLDDDAKYQKIMSLGKQLPPLSEEAKIPENLVHGCQSVMYLASHMEDGLITFEGEADALISAGLAAVLIQVYSGETPETVLTYPPTFLEELGIAGSLTPSRANGLYSMHLRMKQLALKHMVP